MLTPQQLTVLELAAIDGTKFFVGKTKTRAAKRLVKYGLLSTGTYHEATTYQITPKGRIWARRLGLIFLT